jgi:hypothetical protein
MVSCRYSTSSRIIAHYTDRGRLIFDLEGDLAAHTLILSNRGQSQTAHQTPLLPRHYLLADKLARSGLCHKRSNNAAIAGAP